jgi:hypothetical protein
MAQIHGRHAIFRNWPRAKGPGVHADEADSALADVVRKLTHGAALKLAAETGPADVGAVRENPANSVIVQQAELFRPALLVTGMWGPEPVPADRRRAVGVRLLPVVRDNPSSRPNRDDGGFAERMRDLDAELSGLRERALARYRTQGKKGGDWVDQLDKILTAVRFVRAEAQHAKPSILAQDGPGKGLPFGMKWGVVAGKGNKKLPFAAYSELPMATCQGAGKCAVYFGGHRGYCYSFKAWRYPGAYARQFLNTLANYADREFAILRGAGGEVPMTRYEERVDAALRGSALSKGEFGRDAVRVWPQYVKHLVLEVTAPGRAQGKTSFLRLFVDGDINTEDNILEWMRVCEDVGPGGRDVRGGGHVEVYGYSKCWGQFVNVDRAMRTDAERAAGAFGKWPSNYTVNLSTDSIYNAAASSAIRGAMEKLPVSRWYFQGIPLHQHIAQLDQILTTAKDGSNLPIRLPPASEMPFQFDEQRIRDFVAINAVETWAEARKLFPRIPAPKREPKTPEAVRKALYRHYFAVVLKDGGYGLGRTIRRELIKDRASGGDSMAGASAGAPVSESTYLKRLEDKQRAKLLAIALDAKAGEDVSKRLKPMEKYFEDLAQGKSPAKVAREGAFSAAGAFSQKALKDKALAMVLHETFWSLGIGGSCPLVCGNCSDNFEDPSKGVHRCASKTVFKGKVIHIGLHILPIVAALRVVWEIAAGAGMA